MKYDALFVGAGITAATICSQMKSRWKILVVDIRNHIGGNCHDCKIGNNYIQTYCTHNFHCPDHTIVDFLSQYTDWSDFNYSVTAEINQNNVIKRVPFPYSKQTEKLTGVLDEEEILNLFFKDYSKKMWGESFDTLPDSIKNRVPKNTAKKSVYFPGHIQCHPKNGYTRMMENMFDGVDILLNADPEEWKLIPAKRIYYSGRPDLIVSGPKLKFRTIKIEWKNEKWDANTVTVNFCHSGKPYTRKTNYGMYYHNKDAKIISYETPLEASYRDLNPYYPILDDKNTKNYDILKSRIQQEYPNLVLIGRMGKMIYLDIWAAVEDGLNISKKLLA